MYNNRPEKPTFKSWTMFDTYITKSGQLDTARKEAIKQYEERIKLFEKVEELESELSKKSKTIKEYKDLIETLKSEMQKQQKVESTIIEPDKIEPQKTLSIDNNQMSNKTIDSKIILPPTAKSNDGILASRSYNPIYQTDLPTPNINDNPILLSPLINDYSKPIKKR
ncbi:MAG: hypothetical protein RR325_02345 [Bacilli bacterium]